MNNIKIIIALAFDVANMEFENNARACKHAYLYTNKNIYEMIQFCIYL